LGEIEKYHDGLVSSNTGSDDSADEWGGMVGVCGCDRDGIVVSVIVGGDGRDMNTDTRGEVLLNLD